jgi:ammonia channel protein AmtB
MRRHRQILAIGALLLAVGWLAWNALLVESEVSEADMAAEAYGDDASDAP